jgi:hypothetical protein
MWPTLVKYWHSHDAGALLGVSARLSQMVIRKYVRATGEDASAEEIAQRTRQTLPDLEPGMDGATFDGEVEERRRMRAGVGAAITLLAVVEAAIDPSTGRGMVDPACTDAFPVICSAIAPIVEMIKVLEVGASWSRVMDHGP